MLIALRNEIDAINRELVALLGKRLEVAKEIALVKKLQGLSILDPEREMLIKEEIRSLAKEKHLSVSVVESIFEIILDYTRREMDLTQ
jgi:chorismate mutase